MQNAITPEIFGSPLIIDFESTKWSIVKKIMKEKINNTDFESSL